LQSINQQ